MPTDLPTLTRAHLAFERGDHPATREALKAIVPAELTPDDLARYERLRHAMGFDPVLIFVTAAMAIIWVVVFVAGT